MRWFRMKKSYKNAISFIVIDALNSEWQIFQITNYSWFSTSLFFLVEIKTCKFAKNTSRYYLHSWKMEKKKRNAHQFHIFYCDEKRSHRFLSNIEHICASTHRRMFGNSNASEKNVLSIDCWANLLYSLGYWIHFQFENADSIEKKRYREKQCRNAREIA